MHPTLKHDGKPSESASNRRILNFEGGCNFRDLGGYVNKHGEILRWGRIYRTGVLCYFTPDDEAELRKLGVRAICDLRREPERIRERTRWPDSETAHLSWDDGPTPPTIQSLAANRPYSADGMRDSMHDLYRALPNWMIPRLRGMFERIATDEGAVIVHCAAGKDRTGIAIALLLAALDVPEETIVADYLLTNDACDFVQFILTRQEAQLGVAATNHPLVSMPEDIRRVLFGAEADYLRTAFEQIDTEFGGVQSFLSKQLGVDDTLRRALRAALLQVPPG